MTTSSTAGSITFAGIGSNIDVNSLITGLVNAAKAPETAINTHISDAQTRISTLGDLVTKLQALQTSANGFSLRSGAAARTATSSDAAQVSATASSSAIPGSYTVKVTALAAAASFQSATFDSDSDGVAGSGTLQIQTGTGDPVSIDYGDTDSLSGIASKINGAKAGVSATVLDDGSQVRLILTDTASGTAAVPTFTDSGGLGITQLTPASDAKFSVNGIPITRSSNTVNDAIPGLSLTLGAVGSGATVTVANDPSAVAQSVQGLVDAYNAVTKAMNDQLSYNGTTKGPDTLFGDPALQSLQRQMGGLLSASYNGATAADYGITIGSDGTLSVDTTKLLSAVTDNPTGIQDLLAGATAGAGLAPSLAKLINQFVDPIDGALTSESTGLQKQITSYNKQITDIDAQAASLQSRLQEQFNKLDALMSTLNSQMTFINAAFSSTFGTSSKK
jgi:flagellar hook-associated protein 2